MFEKPKRTDLASVESREAEFADALDQGYLTEEALRLGEKGISKVSEDLTAKEINQRIEYLEAAIKHLNKSIAELPPEKEMHRPELKKLLKDRELMLRGLQGLETVHPNFN